MHPSHFGLPAKFSSWRRGQERAIRSLLFTDSRFVAMVLPLGFGKTPTYMAYAGLNSDEERTAVLTATKSLQTQASEDFEEMGLVDMRGRNNYTCDVNPRVTAERGVCTAGIYCSNSKFGPCGYYDAKRDAAASALVITNYRYWLHDEEAGGLGYFSNLVCDEGHDAPQQISSFAAVSLSGRELALWGLPEPPYKRKTKAIATWANQALYVLEHKTTERGGSEESRRDLIGLKRKLARLCRLGDREWVQSGGRAKGWRWDLVDPGVLSEDLLFRGAERVILVSATVRAKTLQMLGVRADQIKLIEQDSTFPVRRRPVYYVPVAKMSVNKTTAEEYRRWHQAQDDIIGARLDRKGIIHSHSYERARQIVNGSKFRDSGVFVLHEPEHVTGIPTDEVIRRFRHRAPPCVLVSPAVSTGVDFPLDECEYQIIPKVPWPDFRDPLVKARQSRDKTYPAYVALQSLVQMTGRGMRSEEDQCECFVLDAHFGWMRYAYGDFMPRWFTSAIRTLDAKSPIPSPPPILAAQ